MTPHYEHNGRVISAGAFYALACDPRRSVAVQACAGAGKTWMLVSRMLRALLEGVDAQGHLTVQPHEILAITFTKRAAAEMRERLYQWLEQFARADPAALVAELASRGVAVGASSVIGTANPSALTQALSGLYAAMLASGREVQIKTFHGWFAGLLRNAPLSLLQRLGLPANYELLEDDAQAIAPVWRRFYAALAAQPSLLAHYQALVQTHGRAMAAKALEGALAKRIEFMLADEAGVPQRSVRPFGEVFASLAQHTEPAESLAGPSARQRWLAWAQALGREGNKTPQKAAQAIEHAFAIEFDGPACVHRLAALRKALFVEKEDRLTQHLKKFAAAQQAEAELVLLCAAQAQHEAHQHQCRMVALTRLLLQEYAALKRERGWIDMNDVERAAGVLLADPVHSGWVQERLDARVKHLLIDEFQDTNPLQWQALQAWLSGYAGSGGGAGGGGKGGGTAPSVFLVGDPKQSIYRFRRAEPQVFLAAQAFVRNGLDGELLSCDHTRRNALAVVEVVNAVMLEAQARGEFVGMRAHTTASTLRGRVCRLPAVPRNGASPESGASSAADDDTLLPGSGAGGANGIGWRDTLNTPRELPEETLRMVEARQAARWISRQLAPTDAAVADPHASALAGDGEAEVQMSLRPSQVMVLSRKRAGLAPMRDALRQLGIAAQIGEKTELIDCCEVQDIVALLDALLSPQHDLSLARALKSPLFGWTDAQLVELALLQRHSESTRVADSLPASWFDLLLNREQDVEHPSGLGAVLTRWREWLSTRMPHDALHAIYHDGDVLARFAAAAPVEQRDTVLANLRALLAVSLEWNGARFVSPYALVRALKAGGVQAPAAVNPHAVRLLTVHGAKGLEAELVVLLDTDALAPALQTHSVLVDWPGEAAHPQQFVFLASEKRPPTCATEALAREQDARGREELNALYVASTRARHTLVASSITPHRETGQSWWKRLHEHLQRVVAADAELNSSDTVTPSGATAVHEFHMKIMPAAPMDVRHNAMNLVVNSGTVDNTEAADTSANDSVVSSADAQVRVGQAMHRLLQWGLVTAAHVQAAAREFALTALQADEAAAMAGRIVAGQGAWAWDPAIIAWGGNEVEILFEGELLRLDRLVQQRDSGQWWVLDYKSASAPQMQPQLLRQMSRYCAAVKAAQGVDVVRAAFLTSTGACIEITEWPRTGASTDSMEHPV